MLIDGYMIVLLSLVRSVVKATRGWYVRRNVLDAQLYLSSQSLVFITARSSSQISTDDVAAMTTDDRYCTQMLITVIDVADRDVGLYRHSADVMSNLENKWNWDNKWKHFRKFMSYSSFRRTTDWAKRKKDGCLCSQIANFMQWKLLEYYIFIFILFTNDKGRLAPLTCHTVQTLKSAVKV